METIILIEQSYSYSYFIGSLELIIGSIEVNQKLYQLNTRMTRYYQDTLEPIF